MDQGMDRGGRTRTASLEMMASSPGWTPCLANSRAAYPCKIGRKLSKNESAREI